MQILIATPDPGHEPTVQQMATLLVDGFKENGNAWGDMDEALEEVHECLDPERICRIALNHTGEVVGWIGGISGYDGNVWELHPLVVRSDQQGRGVGRTLVADFEARVREQGGITITLGTDDEASMTTLSDVDLYPNPWTHIAAVQNLRRHPYEFYQKLGYTIVGIVPDANGIGKPDILMAKRVGNGNQELA